MLLVLSIIPSPHLPKETQLNHYLQPLIDNLEVSWHREVKYLWMVSYSEGHMTCSVIAIAAMDLPAAQSAAQLAHPTAHIYCTVCTCWDQKMLGRVDFDKWTLCSTLYSELWRLPYWSPISQLSVDPMHCLLENLIAIHFHYNLGLTATNAMLPDPPI